MIEQMFLSLLQNPDKYGAKGGEEEKSEKQQYGDHGGKGPGVGDPQKQGRKCIDGKQQNQPREIGPDSVEILFHGDPPSSVSR